MRNIEYLLKDNLFDADNQDVPEKADDDEKICKYCLMEDISEDGFENAKLYPCECKNYVHFLCLKKWI